MIDIALTTEFAITAGGASLHQYSVAGPASTRGVICHGVDAGRGKAASGIEIVAGLVISPLPLFGVKASSDSTLRLLRAA
jgi:hypothetical protein